MSSFSSSIVKRIETFNNLLKHDTIVVTGINGGLPGTSILKANAQTCNVRKLWKDA